MEFGLELSIILIMLVLNGIFAAYEMSLASISHARLRSLSDSKAPGSAAAFFMKGKMEASLAVVQLGITLFGAIAAATGGAGIEESLSPYFIRTLGISHTAAEILSLSILVIPLSACTIVFAELFPKMFALRNPEWVCLKLSPAMKTISRIAFPIIAVFEWSVKRLMQFGSKRWEPSQDSATEGGLHELKAAANLARASRLIGAREEKIVLSASQLSQRMIEEIIVPIHQVSMILLESPLSEALIHAHLDMHTRYPVCARNGDPESIQGYVNFKDIVTALKQSPSDPSLKSILRPILNVQAEEPISLVLERMMQQKHHIALAWKGGRVAGLVTLQDILEEMIGEIPDEQDLLPSHLYPYGSGWIAGGGVKMTELLRTLGQPGWESLKANEDPSLAQWAEQALGSPVWHGAIAAKDGIKLSVRKLRRKKLLEGWVEILR